MAPQVSTTSLNVPDDYDKRPYVADVQWTYTKGVRL